MKFLDFTESMPDNNRCFVFCLSFSHSEWDKIRFLFRIVRLFESLQLYLVVLTIYVKYPLENE